MKRFLSLMVTLTLVFMLFALAAPKVAAAAPVSTCTTDSTVFVHYHRWDDTYTGTTIWTWGYGTDGSGDGGGVVSTDGFGAVYQICVNSTDADAELGLIMKYGDAWSGDDWFDRDSVDLNEDNAKDNKAIVIGDGEGTLEGFTDGEKHVYVLEGSGQVNYTDDANSLPHTEDMATIAIIYYDPAESYEGWNIWTWGTGALGTQVGTVGEGEDAVIYYENSGLPFASGLGVDGGIVENFKVSFINVDPTDMDVEIGFIMRTDAWEKKNLDGENILLSTDGMVAGDFTTLFYIAGEGSMYTDFVTFEAVVNFFEIESAQALDPSSVEVMFNKDVVTKVETVDVFDEASIELEDKDGTAVTIESISYDTTGDINKTFTLILDSDLTGAMSPYTITYTVGEGEEELVYTKEFSVDSLAPVITIIGSKTVTLDLGDLYSLPTYSASDKVTAEDTESSVIYNVKVKDGHGTVDTRNAGIYEVVIVAMDKFGNETEETITVTVEDPCDETAHLDANNFNAELIALLIGIPLALGAMITLRRGY